MSIDDLVRRWWSAIGRAEFEDAAALAHVDGVIDWPLSNERLRIHGDWVAVSDNYPGSWRASIDDVLVAGDRAVTIASVTDGSETALAISIFTVEDSLITRIVEYWPENYDAPAWRAQWTTPIEGD